MNELSLFISNESGKSNVKYQQREAIPRSCTQSEDEPDKNLIKSL